MATLFSSHYEPNGDRFRLSWQAWGRKASALRLLVSSRLPPVIETHVPPSGADTASVGT